VEGVLYERTAAHWRACGIAWSLEKMKADKLRRRGNMGLRIYET
jgi:hypothetical protein